MDCKFAKTPNAEIGYQNGKLQQQQLQQALIGAQQKVRLQPQNNQALLPIDDFHLLENPNKYNEDEKQLRIKLTAVYRLIELNGWSMGIYNHVTVSISQMPS